MKKSLFLVIGLFVINSAAGADKDSSPLSANGYIVQNGPDSVSVTITSSEKDKEQITTKPLIYTINQRVTDPSTINPGEPMPTPTIDDTVIKKGLEEAIRTGRPIIILPQESASMTGRPGGFPIIGPGGATILKTSE